MSDILAQYSVPNLFLLFLKPWSAWDWGLEFTIFIFSTWFIRLIVRKHCFQFFPGITVVSREIEDKRLGKVFFFGGGEGKRGLLWAMWKWWILSSVVNSSIVASASRKMARLTTGDFIAVVSKFQYWNHPFVEWPITFNIRTFPPVVEDLPFLITPQEFKYTAAFTTKTSKSYGSTPEEFVEKVFFFL